MRRGGSVLLAAVLLAACSEGADTSTTGDGAPSTSESVATTDAATNDHGSTTTTSPDSEWDAVPVWSGFQWGDVRTRVFEPAFRFVSPDGTGKGCDEYPNLVDFSPSSDTSGGSGLDVMRLDLGTVDETAAALADGQDNVTPTQPVSVGGADGLTFLLDTSITEGYDQILVTATCEIGFFPNERWAITVVDVNGEVVTFGLYAPVDGFDAVASELQPIIDTVVWKDALG